MAEFANWQWVDLEETSSTNDEVKKLCAAAPSGKRFMVAARRQNAGRGRRYLPVQGDGRRRDSGRGGGERDDAGHLERHRRAGVSVPRDAGRHPEGRYNKTGL